ncbi:IS3 family transposase [Halomonas sp. V046]|uniref:IS3 family transposase n=1 Tax=Halomonas sp. V046 TaxID=3459611 RepID=UPI0040443C5C
MLGVARSPVYSRRRQVSAEHLELMRLIGKEYLCTPVYGSRRITANLRRNGHWVNRKRVQRLMGWHAVYPGPRTTRVNQNHRIYRYLLRGLDIDRPH